MPTPDGVPVVMRSVSYTHLLQTVKGDPIALLHVLDTFVDTSAAELARIGVPSLVVAGTEDNDNGSAEELAGLLLHGRCV